jgi:NAD(P)H-nitrite reductase large subunit
MVTGWADDGALEVTSPQGRGLVRAGAVVLATGARERPRAARLIPGARCEGVYTTGQLQNLVHLKHRQVGRRAVVVGAELVSWSAVLTLREAGCRTELLVSEHEHPESFAVLTAAGKALARTAVARRARVVRILGDTRVTGVELENLATGQRRVVGCDTVVLTGDWVPDNELARAAGLTLDPGSRAPVVDSAMRTDRPGLFAVGNLLHPVDTADVAALDGAAVVPHVLDHLAGRRTSAPHLQLSVDPPLRWVSPARIDTAHPRPARGRLLLWSDERRLAPVVVATQAGRVVARRRMPWPAVPGRVLRVPSSLVDGLDPTDGPVVISLAR